MGYDFRKQVWLNPNIEYLFNDIIVENDMQDAGFNLIKAYKLLPPEKIKELELLDKGFERHRAVGILQKYDKEFSKALNDKFAEMRNLFIGYNKLTDDHIVSVKKDAIYTIGYPKKTKFGPIRFAEKNTYSSYVRFQGTREIEIYYHDNDIDVKGISDNDLDVHRVYMVQFLINTIKMIEEKNRKVQKDVIRFIERYKRGEVEQEYYLRFDAKSKEIDPVYNFKHILIPLVMIISKEVSGFE